MRDDTEDSARVGPAGPGHVTTTSVQVGELSLCVEVLGPPAGRPLLLIHGLGAQLVDWPDELVDGLVAAGFRVVRFDNRDAGLSTHLDALGMPDLVRDAGHPDRAPYLLADLADDAAGLLGALGIGRAHVVGVSMGGMIAQELAIRHPDALSSLCSIMSTTGDPAVGQPSAEALAVLLRAAPAGRDEAIEQSIAGNLVTGSPGFPFDEAAARAKAAARYDRSHDAAGVARQLAAIVASPDRTPALRGLKLPVLVVHGEADPLVAVSGGRATAAAVPGAEIVTFPGMGHDLPAALIPEIVTRITRLADRADRVDGSSETGAPGRPGDEGRAGDGKDDDED